MPRARTTLARLAVNGTLAGFWAAALLALLIFYLNPGIRLTARTYFALALPLMLVYGLASGLGWALLAGLVRLFVSFRLRVPWLGFRPFWRFFVADLVVLTLVYRHNLRAVRAYVPPSKEPNLAAATLFLALGAGLLGIDAAVRGWRGQRLRPAPLLIAGLLLTGGLLTIRERHRTPPPAPSASEFEPAPLTTGLLLVGWSGADPDDLLPLAADGTLPQVHDLARQGSSVPVRSAQPPRGGAAWASLLTGRAPFTHGVLDETLLRPPSGGPVVSLVPVGVGLHRLATFGLFRPEPREPRSPRVASLDVITWRSGFDVVAAGWDGLLIREDPAGLDRHGATGQVPAAAAVHLDQLQRHLETARRDPLGADLAAALDQSLSRDLAVGRAVLAAGAPAPDRVRAVFARFTGLDRVAHLFLRYHRPERFGNVTEEEIERYGDVLPDYYRFLDAWLGALRPVAGPEAIVALVSPYGMRPVGIPTRILQAVTGAPPVSGTHTRAGPGLLLAAGPPIRSGGRFERARAEDVVPTLLYLLDLPVGGDMEGQPFSALASDAFAEGKALSAVPSWETVTVVPARALVYDAPPPENGP